ncbi:MAG TPA: hypothetical protein VEP90_21785 [Methylomirabilota bacterium]|nr:hypothetical protein [Methylomirabilota bacterium]
MTNKKYTSIAANQPVGKTKAGVDDYKVIGGQPNKPSKINGGSKGKKKSLGRMKRTKNQPRFIRKETMAKNNGQSYPKSGSLGYTYLAKNMPTNRTNGGVDNWRVVGGVPGSQDTSKDGPGQFKNDGKIID